jgi:hypothetical protein
MSNLSSITVQHSSLSDFFSAIKKARTMEKPEFDYLMCCGNTLNFIKEKAGLCKEDKVLYGSTFLGMLVMVRDFIPEGRILLCLPSVKHGSLPQVKQILEVY